MTMLDFPRHPARQVRTLGIEALLEWAFVTECIRIHDHDDGNWNHRRRHGTEWTILQRKMLGTVIQGGKGFIRDRSHPDAETVALVIEATLPRLEGLVLRDVACGSKPDPMVGAIPRVIPAQPAKMRLDPVDGQFRTVGEIVTRQTWPDGWMGELWEWTSGYRRVKYVSRVTPITFEPDHHTIAQARRAYAEWWTLLDAVRRALAGRLRDHRLTDEMPMREPWAATPTVVSGERHATSC